MSEQIKKKSIESTAISSGKETAIALAGLGLALGGGWLAISDASWNEQGRAEEQTIVREILPAVDTDMRHYYVEELKWSREKRMQHSRENTVISSLAMIAGIGMIGAATVNARQRIGGSND